MMQSYIEDKYLVHYFNALIKSDRFSDEDKKRQAIYDFFKSKTNIILNSDFETVLNKLDPIYKDFCTNLLNGLTTGRNGTVIKTKNSNMSYNLNRLDVYSKVKEPFATFWIDEQQTKFDCDKYMSINPYCFFSKKNELKEWVKMDEQKSFHVGPRRNNEENILDNWEQFKKYEHPFKDLLLFDKYCLMDKYRIKQNIIPLIVNLAKFPESVKNVMIFIRGKSDLYSNSLKETQEYILKLLQKEGLKNTSVAIYLCYDRAPHDRCVITNNKVIISGDSFDYFKPEGGFKTNGTYLTIEPIYSSNKSFVSQNLDNLKNIVLNANELNSYGTKTKNMLDFI